jgi:hypothetical protein
MKLEDKLETLVRKNRDHFDDHEPSDKIWGKIESKLYLDLPEKKSWLWLNYWQAAAVFFFVAASVLSLLLYRSQPQEPLAQQNEPIEFEAVEAYYANAISEKKVELIALSANSPELIGQFESDLLVLDSLYLNLKSGVDNSGDPQQVQDAMVQNLKLRIEILNMQLSILTGIKNTQNNKNDETNL